MMRRLRLTAFLFATSLTGVTYADGGYYTGVKGARAAGRAGAFTARADDLSAVALNPAGLVRIRTTTIQAGNRFSYNAASYHRAPTLDWAITTEPPPYVEFDKVENDAPWQFLDPMVGIASPLGLADWTFAFAVFSPAGTSKAEYPIDGGQRYMMVSRDVAFLNITASAAYRVSDKFGIGASLVWINVPWLNYELVVNGSPLSGVNPVTSPMDIRAKTSGSDLFTLNGILGAWFRPAPFLEFGVSGQVIPSQIETSSKLELEAISESLTDEPIKPTRKGVPADDIKLSLPLPLTARAGVRYRKLEGDRELFDIELDFTYETWSAVDDFTVESDGLEAEVRGVSIDIGTINLKKAWQDTYSVSLGSDVVVVPDSLTVRGGMFYTSAVATPAYASIDFPSGKQVGGALGASVFAGPVELAFAYEYRQQLPLAVSGADASVYQEVPASPCAAPYTDPGLCNPQFLGQKSPAVNAGRYESSAHVVSLDGLYRF